MRNVRVAAAQLGPIQKDDSRQVVVARMVELMDQAAAQKADLIVYPELALTTFFPRWHYEDRAEADFWFEREMPNAATRPLFERASEARHGDVLRLCRADARGAPFQHLDPRRPRRHDRRPLPQGAPARPCRIRPAAHATSIWRSAISSPATSASRSGACSTASSACASATTAAGPRPTASWGCKASR